jgi:hypothetical protein
MYWRWGPFFFTVFFRKNYEVETLNLEGPEQVSPLPEVISNRRATKSGLLAGSCGVAQSRSGSHAAKTCIESNRMH